MSRQAEKTASVRGMASPATILFDLDGTLADSLPVMRMIYAEFAVANGFSPSDEEFEALNGPSLATIVGYLKEKHGLKGASAELMRVYEGLLKRFYVEKVAPFEGAADMLERCAERGVKCFLVTSSQREIVRAWIGHNQWQGYFHGYVYGDDVERAKPHGDIYRLAMERYALHPGDILVFEDSVNGVLAARDAGLDVVGVGNDRERLLAAGASHIVGSLEEAMQGLA